MSRIPRYQTLADDLLRRIRAGSFSDGRLPGRRQIEAEYAASRSTVDAALAILERERWIAVSPKRRPLITAGRAEFGVKLGSYLSGSGFRPPRMNAAFERMDAAEDALAAAADERVPQTQQVIDLSMLCHEHWDGHISSDLELAANGQAFREYRAGRSTLFSTTGMLSLRKAVCRHLAGIGIAAEPDEICIVSRRLQAYRLISEVLLGPSTELWYPEVSLVRFYSIAERHTGRRQAMATDEKGRIELERFMRSRDPRLLMLEPDHAKPLGRSLTEIERRMLVDAGRASGAFILEDAYCRLTYEDAGLPMAAFDPGKDTVIHIGALPVWLSALGCFTYIVANRKIISLLRASGRRDYLNPGLFSQLLGERLFEPETLNELLRRFHAFHRQRIADADRILREVLGRRFSWQIPSSFGCIWLDCAGKNLAKIYRARRGVDFQPGRFYGEKENRHALLRYTMPLETFEEGVRRFVRAAEEAGCAGQAKERVGILGRIGKY